jgi:hypothetical protein
MKKIIVLTMSVLFSTLVFANDTDGPSTGNSSVAVSNANGSKLVKVFYKAQQFGNVKVSIVNDQHEVVFTEKVKKTDGFMRPYNFEGLKEGEYTVKIEDASGKYSEKVNYAGGSIKTLIRFAKLTGEQGRYVMTGRAYREERITVRFYNSAHQVVFEQRHKVEGEFGEVYNLKNVPGAFSVEIFDSQGLLTTAEYD